jgi:hypothetical protein
MPHHLLDNIIQIFALTDFDPLVFISIVLLYGGCVGATFVDIDQAGFAAYSAKIATKPLNVPVFSI